MYIDDVDLIDTGVRGGSRLGGVYGVVAVHLATGHGESAGESERRLRSAESRSETSGRL